MRDLCVKCKNYGVCPQGEGSKLNPTIKITALTNDRKDYAGFFDVIECDLFDQETEK